MALPKAVQDQVDRAKEIHKAVYGEGQQQQDPPATPDPGPPAPQIPPGEAVPPAPPEPVQPDPNQPPVEVTPPPPGDTVPRADYETLKAQFDRLVAAHATLKGKYDSEPGRLAADNAAILRENRALVDENTRLKQGIVPPAAGAPPAAASAPAADTNAFARWFEDTYGPEHRGEFDAYLQSMVQKTMGDLPKDVAQVKNVAERTEKEAYWAALDSAVPGWDAIYEDPRFAALLQEEEGNTGAPKAQFAKRWESERNSDRVIPYLKEYQKRYGVPTPAPGAAAAPRAGAPRKNKADFVAPAATPGGSGGPAPRPEDNIPFVKASEISALAQEVVTTRKWVGRDTELAALRAKHRAAQAAGKVLAGQ